MTTHSKNKYPKSQGKANSKIVQNKVITSRLARRTDLFSAK